MNIIKNIICRVDDHGQRGAFIVPVKAEDQDLLLRGGIPPLQRPLKTKVGAGAYLKGEMAQKCINAAKEAAEEYQSQGRRPMRLIKIYVDGTIQPHV